MWQYYIIQNVTNTLREFQLIFFIRSFTSIKVTNHTQISGNSGSSFLIKITKPLGPSLDRMVRLDFLFGMIEQSTYIPAETYLILKIPRRQKYTRKILINRQKHAIYVSKPDILIAIGHSGFRLNKAHWKRYQNGFKLKTSSQ